jgi:CheY-like chemotaxis protein
MSKTVLLIESDTKFAREMSAALESSGFGVRTSSDGKEGVELARALRPDCVVLCVELTGLSGYSWCNRLKKDEALKAIPLVITSSEATPETFEQHRKLKTRAEDYLIKPFPPATLVERVGALVGMPEAPASDEDLITLADVELDGAGGGATANEVDADLKMLDDAFDSISGGGDEPSTRAPGAPVAEPPLTLLPDADESPAILDLDREMAEALASLAAEASAPARIAPFDAARPPRPVRLVEPTVEPVAEDEDTPLLLEDVEVLPAIDVADESAAVAAVAAAALQASQEEARALREEVDRLRSASAGWENEVGARNAELASTRSRLESVQESARALASSLDTDREALRLSRDRSSELERELGALRPHLEESEKAASARGAEAIEAVDRADGLERTLEEARAEAAAARAEAEALRAEGDTLRSEAETLRAEGVNLRAEVVHLRGEVEGLRAEAANFRTEAEGFRVAATAFRSEAEARAAGLAQRLEESEAQVAQHEDRVLHAYQKIKSDEKVRAKTRKALAMVIQVLEERSPGDGTAPPATPER